MKTTEFIVYKDAVIDYLREFVKELQKNYYNIEETLKKLDKHQQDKVLSKVLAYERSIPRIDVKISDEALYEIIKGKWNHFKEWFLGTDAGESEAVKLFEITNEIIRKITRFASQIAESRNSAANRKEEYKKLCEMFLSCKDMDEAHQLSALTFGIFNTRHIKSGMVRKTESVNSGVFDEEPIAIEIKPRVRNYREKSSRNAIQDKSQKKQQLLQKYIKQREQEQEVMDSYIDNQRIHFSQLPRIPSHVRVTLLKWIGKATVSAEKTGKTEDGRTFRLIEPVNEERCVLQSEDGDLQMPAYVIEFDEHVLGKEQKDERIGVTA